MSEWGGLEGCKDEGGGFQEEERGGFKEKWGEWTVSRKNEEGLRRNDEGGGIQGKRGRGLMREEEGFEREDDRKKIEVLKRKVRV